MKNHRTLTGLVTCCVLGLMMSASMGTGATDDRVLTNQQLDRIVGPDLYSCEASVETQQGRIATSRFNMDYVLPDRNARQPDPERVGRTLHGVWRGEVRGDHGEVNIDYVWIIDIKNREGLVLASRSGSPTLAKSEIKDPPKFSFLLCANHGYAPELSQPQLHIFTKVAYGLGDMRQIVEEVTGVRFDRAPGMSLSDMWQELVDMGYFENMPHLAFGGAIFKPIKIETVPGLRGPDELAVSWDSEYRGGGDTLIEFRENEPIIGNESGQFVATTSSSGQLYLVASPGNGQPWKVETFGNRVDANYDLEFPMATVGPLEDL